MGDNEKIFNHFLVGSFITATLMIILYRAIKTTEDMFAFFFLSSLIVMFFTTFLLESIILESVTEKIIAAAKRSALIYNLLLFSFFVSVAILVPLTIVHNIKAALNDKQNVTPVHCLLVIDRLFDSPKSIYDQKLLSKCQYTQPIAKAISTQNSDTKNLLTIVDDYMGLISQNLSFGVTLLLTILFGAGYLATIGLVIKKGAVLLLALLSSSATKMIIDGTSPPK